MTKVGCNRDTEVMERIYCQKQDFQLETIQESIQANIFLRLGNYQSSETIQKEERKQGEENQAKFKGFAIT